MERRIATVWQEMLGVSEIGRSDSFFDLGGHSLLAVRMMARLNEVLGTEIPVAKLYEGLTVGFLARLIEPTATETRTKTDAEGARDERRDRARRQKEHQQRRLATPRREGATDVRA
jgi:acyl carrier protein